MIRLLRVNRMASNTILTKSENFHPHRQKSCGARIANGSTYRGRAERLNLSVTNASGDRGSLMRTISASMGKGRNKRRHWSQRKAVSRRQCLRSTAYAQVGFAWSASAWIARESRHRTRSNATAKKALIGQGGANAENGEGVESKASPSGGVATNVQQAKAPRDGTRLWQGAARQRRRWQGNGTDCWAKQSEGGT